MSSDPTITPPPPGTPDTATVERQRVRFSGVRWFFMGIVRLSYRAWTRIATHLFPENSPSEQLARTLHLPLPDKLNMNWVSDQLAVGGRVHPEDIAALARSGVTAVIDTRSEYRDDAKAMAKEHIELLHLPTPDTYPLTIEQLMQGATWAHERIQKHGRVLIHCEHGVGRSVLLTCAVLVYGGMSAQAALQLVQVKRWQAAPNYKQTQRLREFESACLALRRKSST
ncbi:MAG: dual specificity protein phosphatase family protein [Chloroflexota bacterium]|nr:dual specificity protein phosphatase family protein [Chloroflexota bacterium]